MDLGRSPHRALRECNSTVLGLQDIQVVMVIMIWQTGKISQRNGEKTISEEEMTILKDNRKYLPLKQIY